MVPSRPPTDRLMMNRTGYSLLGMLRQTALKPRASEASPMAVNSTLCHSGRMPRFSAPPMSEPTMMVHVLVMVPNIDDIINYGAKVQETRDL